MTEAAGDRSAVEDCRSEGSDQESGVHSASSLLILKHDTLSANTKPLSAIPHHFRPSDLERPAATLTRAFCRMRLVINTMSKSRVVEALVDLKRQAEYLESAFNDEYRMARNTFLETAARLENDKQEHHD